MAKTLSCPPVLGTKGHLGVQRTWHASPTWDFFKWRFLRNGPTLLLYLRGLLPSLPYASLHLLLYNLS